MALLFALAMFVSPLLAQPPPGRTDATPQEVVEEFYRATNAGDCARARALMTASAAKEIEATLANEGGFATFCGSNANKGALERVELRKYVVSDGFVAVTLERHYASGGLALQTDYLVKDRGRWRLTLRPPAKSARRP